jgi:uroporphyrinogen-III synthase
LPTNLSAFMIKPKAKASKIENGKVKTVLITQPKPDGDKSPYYELAKKYDLSLDFHPFIMVEGVDAKDFRKQKIEIGSYTGVVFTSKNAIDHFFRISTELKVTISQDTKYFCITEAVALYLQKFIQYRKRKVFYGADGTNKSMFDVINKHKENIRFLYPCSENTDKQITDWLTSNKCDFVTAIMFKIVSNDVKEVVAKNYDIICFFTPGGVKSLLENFPNYKQKTTRIGTFGANTSKAAEEAGLKLEILAPQPKAPSMVSALEMFLTTQGKVK